MKKVLESRQENKSKAEKGEDRRSNRIRQNNKRAHRKVGSKDSPEIPDRGEASEILSLPSGLATVTRNE